MDCLRFSGPRNHRIPHAEKDFTKSSERSVFMGKTRRTNRRTNQSLNLWGRAICARAVADAGAALPNVKAAASSATKG